MGSMIQHIIQLSHLRYTGITFNVNITNINIKNFFNSLVNIKLNN